MCVQFRHVPGNVFTAKFGKEFDRNTNELVIRIQPEEAIYMKINNKVPGLGLNVTPTRLDLSYKDDLKVGQLPDAYERLLLDVVNGAPPLACIGGMHVLLVESASMCQDWQRLRGPCVDPV